MFDSHCHLTHSRLSEDLEDVLARARDAGMVGCVTIGTGVEDARACRELAATREWIHCSAGLDPFGAHAAGEAFRDEFDRLSDLVVAGGFVAVGEIGLDYHYDLGEPAAQIERLECQLSLAVERSLPVVIHVREAHADMAEVLGRFPGLPGVIHSFTAGPAEARRYLDLGWMLAFNGVLTFRNAEEVREAARLVPEDRLLVETDSPYLAPVPMRGRRCEPGHVAHTIDALAAVRGLDSATVRSRTTENARKLFGLTGP